MPFGHIGKVARKLGGLFLGLHLQSRLEVHQCFFHFGKSYAMIVMIVLPAGIAPTSGRKQTA